MLLRRRNADQSSVLDTAASVLRLRVVGGRARECRAGDASPHQAMRPRSLSDRISGKSPRRVLDSIFTLELHLAGGGTRMVERSWEEFIDLRDDTTEIMLLRETAISAIVFPAGLPGGIPKRGRRRSLTHRLSGTNDESNAHEWCKGLERWANDTLRVCDGDKATTALQHFFLARDADAHCAADDQDDESVEDATKGQRARGRDAVRAWLSQLLVDRSECTDGVIAAFDDMRGSRVYQPDDWVMTLKQMSETDRVDDFDCDEGTDSTPVLNRAAPLERLLQDALERQETM